MKKILSVLLAVALCTSMCLTGCQKSDKSEKNSKDSNTEKELVDVKLNEVAHSIFYAPQYVAIEEGYFTKEGIRLECVTGFGADKTMTAVLSGDADIGFMGAEASVYAYQEGANDAAVNFAQLTQRAGNFLVSRKKIKNFSWNDIKGKEVIGGRKGGMPQMIFEYVLKKQKIDPKKDIKMVQNIYFANTSGAFSGGTGDFTVEFEPNATALETQGAGYVAASIGVESGFVPYTTYCAKKSYIKKNPKIIQGFTNAIKKGQEYVNKHTPEEIAAVIGGQFPDVSKNDLITIIKRYKDQDTYKENPVFSEDGFALLQDILKNAGELDDSVPFDKLVDNTFAEKAK